MEFPPSKCTGTSYLQKAFGSSLMPFRWDLVVRSEQAGSERKTRLRLLTTRHRWWLIIGNYLFWSYPAFSFLASPLINWVALTACGSISCLIDESHKSPIKLIKLGGGRCVREKPGGEGGHLCDFLSHKATQSWGRHRRGFHPPAPVLECCVDTDLDLPPRWAVSSRESWDLGTQFGTIRDKVWSAHRKRWENALAFQRRERRPLLGGPEVVMVGRGYQRKFSGSDRVWPGS